jgi:8-oxo-dGTP diphosphatase
VTEPIRASGGIVVRRSAGGPEVLVVHRPRYDDWSLPKGKDHPGEAPEQAAVREVEEETRVRAVIVAPLPEVAYPTSAGPKVVRYFVMRAETTGEFAPNDEVDEIRWVSPEEAARLLSYDHDRNLVAATDLVRAARSGLFYLIRHAAAGSRIEWSGDDHLRPLSRRGERQAAAIAEQMRNAGVERILSSPYLRCRQTVEPLAGILGLDIQEHPSLAEAADERHTIDLLETMGGWTVAVSSHGDVIPAMLDRLVRRGLTLVSPFDCKKGSTWVLQMEAGVFTTAEYLPPPEA